MAIGSLLAAGIDPDSLQPVDPGPVFTRHFYDVVARFDDAISQLMTLREQFVAKPCADQALDEAMPELGKLLAATDQSIGRFRATRDCKGSA